MKSKPFKFELREVLSLVDPMGRRFAAEIVGRAEYAVQENTYWTRRYKGNGQWLSEWWPESAIVAMQRRANRRRKRLAGGGSTQGQQEGAETLP